MLVSSKHKHLRLKHYLARINTIEWDASGTYLATASFDGKAKVIDYRSENVIFDGKSSGARICMSYNESKNSLQKLGQVASLSLCHDSWRRSQGI